MDNRAILGIFLIGCEIPILLQDKRTIVSVETLVGDFVERSDCDGRS